MLQEKNDNYTTSLGEHALLNKMALVHLSRFLEYYRQTCFIDFREKIGGGLFKRTSDETLQVQK